MPSQINANTTPEEIEAGADEYLKLLATSSLSYDRNTVVANMKQKAAGLQTPPMSVSDWETMWSSKSVKEEPEAPKAAPKAAKPKARGVVTRDKDYFYVSTENSAAAATWMELNAAGDRMHMLLTGPAGCGKTSLFYEIGKRYDLPVYKVDAAAVTSIDRWLGHKDVRITERGPETTYVMSEFLRWVSSDGFDPGIVLIDEITRVPPQVSNILMSILDGSESVWVPELGIRVNVNPEVRFGATANIGVGFSGTYALDQALQDRFGVTLEATYPEEAEEVQVLVRKQGIEDDEALKLVRIANQIRNKSDEIDRPVSTRMLLNAALWVAKGRSIIDACEATFVKQYSDVGKTDSDRTKVRLVIQGIAGSSKKP